MWDKAPIDDYVIDHVESLAEGKDQPIILNGVLIFEWVSGESIDDGLEENNNEIFSPPALYPPLRTCDRANTYRRDQQLLQRIRGRSRFLRCLRQR